MLTKQQITRIVERVVEGPHVTITFDVNSQGSPIVATVLINGLIDSTVTRIRFDLVGGDLPVVEFAFGINFVPIRDLDYLISVAESLADRIEARLEEADYEDYKKRMREYE